MRTQNQTIIPKSDRGPNQTSRVLLMFVFTHVETNGKKVNGKYQSCHRIERQSTEKDEFDEMNCRNRHVDQHDKDEGHEKFTLVFSQANDGEDGCDDASDWAAEQR